MKKLFSILILAIPLHSCNSTNSYLKKADLAIQKGSYREGIQLLDKALAKGKFIGTAYFDKAHCYTQLNQDDSAIIVYSQLLSFVPDNTLALYNIGLCKFRQDKFHEAIAYFNSALMTKGYNPEDSAKSQFLMEYTPAGNEILGKPNKIDVPFSEIFYMAGLTHYELGQLRKAYSYFTKCISRQYNIGESHYMIGLCWLTSKKRDEACESFKNSVINGYSQASEQLAEHCK